MSISKKIVASTIFALILFSDLNGQNSTSRSTLGASAPALSYVVAEDFLNIPSEANFGEVAAVAVDGRQHLYVFNRGPRPLMEFDSAGHYVRELAQGLVSHAHSIRVDRRGYLWLVDDADHHVIKLDSRGRVKMVLGRRGRSGETDELFNRPTDVAVNSKGEIYVADGYGNSRIVKFSWDGRFIMSWGSKGKGPGQFDTPHAVVTDSQDKVYVADRENRRIQVFEPNGRFIAEWTGFIYPQGLCLGSDGSIYVGDVSRIVKLDLTGRVVGIFGAKGKGPGQFAGLHGLAVGRSGEIFTAELLNWRVQKLMAGKPGRSGSRSSR